jgi:hypothetical protein
VSSTNAAFYDIPSPSGKQELLHKISVEGVFKNLSTNSHSFLVVIMDTHSMKMAAF